MELNSSTYITQDHTLPDGSVLRAGTIVIFVDRGTHSQFYAVINSGPDSFMRQMSLDNAQRARLGFFDPTNSAHNSARPVLRAVAVLNDEYVLDPGDWLIGAFEEGCDLWHLRTSAVTADITIGRALRYVPQLQAACTPVVEEEPGEDEGESYGGQCMMQGMHCKVLVWDPWGGDYDSLDADPEWVANLNLRFLSMPGLGWDYYQIDIPGTDGRCQRAVPPEHSIVQPVLPHPEYFELCVLPTHLIQHLFAPITDED